MVLLRRVMLSVSLSTIEPSCPMAVRSERFSANEHSFLADADVLALRNTFLAQLKTIDVRSREFTETLAKMLSSQESVNTVMSLQGNDAQDLVDFLDQVSSWWRMTGSSCLIPSSQALDIPDMDLDLRKKTFRVLWKVCGSQIILPRSSILSNNVAREGDIAFACGGFADIWEGRHNGGRVCIKAFRVFAAEDLRKVKQVYTHILT